MKAVTCIDECIGRVVEAIEEVNGQLFICADHGNAEVMVDEETGEPWTAHTTNPVPFILVNYDPAYTLREGGCLADIAPTLIEMMGMDFCEGTLEGKNVVIVQCGMGKVNAGVCANTLIGEFGCTKIINTGVAGSLDNQIDIGDIVVSVDAVQHDFTVEAIGFQKGEIPYTGLYAFPADEEMRKMAVAAAQEGAPDQHVFEGRVCTGDQFISSKEQKEKILSDFGGLCCEMEAAANCASIVKCMVAEL